MSRFVPVALLALLAGMPGPALGLMSLGGTLAHSPDDIPAGFSTLLGNDSTVDVTLPFTFTVEGVNYTTLSLSTNGWLEFGANTSGNSDPSNDCLPTSAHTNPFLAAYWDDLNPFGTNVRYGTVGSSPNRVFIADFNVDINVGEGADDLGFQIQLHERANVITVRYRDSQANANGQGATIGFQGAGGAVATAYPLVCNGKVLDDNQPNEGWSADVGRAGAGRLSALIEHSPDDISGFTTLTGDDNVANVTLPFNVTLEGTSYSSIALSTNGWLEFGGNTSGNSDPTNDCLPTAAHTHPLVAAYWDDLNPFGTAVRYGTVGSSPNRVFIADFEADLVSGVEGQDDLRFQVQIHEGSSLINVKYRDAQNNANGQAATIGFQGAGGASAAAYPIVCNGKVLDDNDVEREGWSIDAKAAGRGALHGIMASSPDDITGFTALSGDDSTATAIMPFSIDIDGTSYSSVAISTNGWLEFGGNTSGNSSPTNTCLPTATHTNPFLAFYWDDMRTINTAIRYGTVGSAGGRVFIVDVDFENNNANNHDMTMQVEVHERSNAITVKYRDSQDEANGQTATIGWQGAGGASATAQPLTCNGKIIDDNRPNGGWSVSPQPVCGNGLTEALGGELCDAGVSNGSPSSCCTATCQFRAPGAICRTGGGAPCDLNETCTGASPTCPADDAPGNAGITCRLGSGDACDPDEVCNGTPGVACPGDVVTAGGTQCRAGSGDLCDPAEACTGVAGAPCPPNVVNGTSTVCRAGSGDACDTSETCPGIPGGTCPADDAPLNAGVVCRGGSGDLCDTNETCPGTPGAPCPPDDAPGKAGVVCRPSSAGGSFCDQDEACSGVPGTTCPPNDAPAKVNVVCRPGSGDLCDPDERCTGISGQGCPADVVANPTTVCRAGSGDGCDPDEHCTAVPGAPCPANTVSPPGTVCRASTGICDVAEECSGTAGAACPANTVTPAGTPCEEDGNLCTVDKCNASGACVFSNPLDCQDGNTCTQDSCNPSTGCVSSGSPSTSCLAGGRVTFQLRDNATDNRRDRLKFRWKGGPVLLGDMGDPTQTTRYELCVYDADGVIALGVPPGPGWKTIGSIASPKGYKYKDRYALSQGVKQIRLKASSLDRARLQVTGKGDLLPDTTLPFLLPVTAQLYSSDGMCWDAEFGAAHTRRNEQGVFYGKTP